MEQSVKIRQIKKFISSLEKNGMKDDTDITFSFLIISLFPKAYDNITEKMSQQYIEGYNAAKKQLEQ